MANNDLTPYNIVRWTCMVLTGLNFILSLIVFIHGLFNDRELSSLIALGIYVLLHVLVFWGFYSEDLVCCIIFGVYCFAVWIYGIYHGLKWYNDINVIIFGSLTITYCILLYNKGK